MPRPLQKVRLIYSNSSIPLRCPFRSERHPLALCFQRRKRKFVVSKKIKITPCDLTYSSKSHDVQFLVSASFVRLNSSSTKLSLLSRGAVFWSSPLSTPWSDSHSEVCTQRVSCPLLLFEKKINNHDFSRVICRTSSLSISLLLGQNTATV